MQNHDLHPSLLFKLNENQLAIAAAVEELANWVEARGSADVARNAREALALSMIIESSLLVELLS